MPGISTQIAEALMRHDVDLLRLDAGSRRLVTGMLRGLSQDLVKKLYAHDPSKFVKLSARDKGLRLLYGSANKDIERAYNEIERATNIERRDIARVEAVRLADAVNGTINVDLMSGRLGVNQLKALAGDTLINGAPSAEWWGRQSNQLQQAFQDQIREGVLAGESIDDMVRRIRGTSTGKRHPYWIDGKKRIYTEFKGGIMDTSTRNAQALARSSVMAVANEARLATYEQNLDVIKGVQWLSTLDKRTSDICKALDGQAWTLPDHKRLPGTEHAWRGPPPAHWQCRSTLVPVMRSWSDMITNPTTKKKMLKYEDKLPKGWRASFDGKVSEDIKYEDWFKTQSAEEQLKILGPSKHALWKQGKLPFTKLIDQSHRPLTVVELEKEAGITSAAILREQSQALYEKSVVHVTSQPESHAKEFAYIFDNKNNVLLKKSGTTNHISFTDQDMQNITGKHATVVHNHPLGNSLSGDDIVFSSAAKLDRMIATTMDGSTYVAKPLLKSMKKMEDIVDAVHDSAMQQIYNEMKTLSLSEAEANFLHGVLLNTSLDRLKAVQFTIETRGTLLNKYMRKIDDTTLNRLVSNIVKEVNNAGL